MSKSTKKAPNSKTSTATNQDELSEKELDEVAGGIVVQNVIAPLMQNLKVPSVTAPVIPGQKDLPL